MLQCCYAAYQLVGNSWSWTGVNVWVTPALIAHIWYCTASRDDAQQNIMVGALISASFNRSWTRVYNREVIDNGFISSTDSYPSVLYLVALFCLCLVPLWVVVASKHPASQTLLQTGWMPVITALVISRCWLHSHELRWSGIGSLLMQYHLRKLISNWMSPVNVLVEINLS